MKQSVFVTSIAGGLIATAVIVYAASVFVISGETQVSPVASTDVTNVGAETETTDVKAATVPTGPTEAANVSATAKSTATVPQTTGTAIPAGTSTSTASAPTGGITLAQVAQHAVGKDCWVVISGKVYDASGYASEHPGGGRSITNSCGKDVTVAFDRVRSHMGSEAQSVLSDMYIGYVAQ